MTTYTDAINYGDYIHTNTFLTNFATGYKLANPVADFIAPPLLVKRPADKYAEYTKTQNRVYQNRVSGTEEPKEITFDVSEGTYNCKEYHLSKGVAWRSKRNTDNIFQLDYDAVRMLKRAQAIAREYRVWAQAGSSSVITQYQDISGSNLWSVAAGTPVKDILNGKAQIASATGGYEANRMVIPLPVALKMIQTTEWKSYFQYTVTGFSEGLWGVTQGLRHLGIEPMITNVMGLTDPEISGSSPAMETIWGNSCLLFYCEPTPSLETRTLMYSPYTLRDVITTEPQRLKRRDLHTIYEEIDELLIDASCGFLYTNTI